MLIGIPKLLSPDLLKILCEMGHGDTVVIADGNFPAAACAHRLIRLDGHGTEAVLQAILEVFPLDESPAKILGVMRNDSDENPTIWQKYTAICNNDVELEYIERFEFYERAKKAYCVIATSEAALFANVILKKGVI